MIICNLTYGSAPPKKMLLSGDSLLSAFETYADVATLVFTGDDNTRGYVCDNMAVPGDFINDQKGRWEGRSDQQDFDAVWMQAGIADVDAVVTVSELCGRVEAFIASVRSLGKPGVKVVLGTLTPFRQAIDDFYGAGTPEALLCYQNYVDFNEALMGEGPNAIDADYHMDEHSVKMDNGTGYLKAEYDVDGTHDNDLGRQVNADAIKKSFVGAQLYTA